MSKTRKVGDISLPVGTYEGEGGKKKMRYRRIGAVMATEYDDGTEGMWIKIQGESLAPGLLTLSVMCGALKKGDDMVMLSVFAEDEKKKDEKGQKKEVADDDVPY